MIKRCTQWLISAVATPRRPGPSNYMIIYKIKRSLQVTHCYLVPNKT